MDACEMMLLKQEDELVGGSNGVMAREVNLAQQKLPLEVIGPAPVQEAPKEVKQNTQQPSELSANILMKKSDSKTKRASIVTE